jgi:hypothetical protein
MLCSSIRIYHFNMYIDMIHLSKYQVNKGWKILVNYELCHFVWKTLIDVALQITLNKNVGKPDKCNY